MKKLFIALITTILITPISTHAACTATPDCATLGYTATSCASGGVRCPFDTTKLFCPTPPPTNNACAVGDVFYSDKTCNPAKISGKTPIGVIGHIIGKTYYVINLAEPGTMSWGPSNQYIPGIPQQYYSDANLDMAGKVNTAAIVSYVGEDADYAAAHCYRFTTAGTSKGDWYLPAAGELLPVIGRNQSYVNNGLKIAGGNSITVSSVYNYGTWYWSSSERNYQEAWVISASGGGGSGSNGKYYSSRVRCLMSF